MLGDLESVIAKKVGASSVPGFSEGITDSPKVRSNREIIFIHGYTGGPTDFAELPEILRMEFSADVHVPLLPGHGTSIDDLLAFSGDELFIEVENRIAGALAAGKKVVLIGISLGAQAALQLASKYPVAATVAINATQGLRFPLSLPGIGLLARLKPAWNKGFSEAELRDRATAILYPEMPSQGLFLTRKLGRRVEAGAHNIHSAVLFINSTRERFSDLRSIERLREKIPGKTEIWRVYDSRHSLFFSGVRQQVIDEIVHFLQRAEVFGSITASPAAEMKASAIVPAYNEASHVVDVVEALKRTPLVGEIIVVDDGSSDDTSERVKSIDGLRILRNATNLGKAASLDRGVRAAAYDILFFCDADLVGFEPKHAEAILRPVVDGDYDMFVGVRGNMMQTMVRAWALNSGERALRKEIWLSLPKYYKHRFRVEVGLNYCAKHYSARGLGWRKFKYSQTLKESKYGILLGTLLRWWMIFDVAAAYLSYPIMRRQLRHGSGKGSRDMTASMMTPDQIAEAQRLAREWKPTSER